VGELDRMIEFNLVHGLEIKDQSLEMDEEEGGERVKSMILLNGFYLRVTGLAEIVADYLCFSVLVDALFKSFQVFNLH
jgi:hypothetical protein